MIVHLDSKQEAPTRRRLLADFVWLVCHSELTRLNEEEATTLLPVEIFLSARQFCDVILNLPDIDEGIDDEMVGLEKEAECQNDAMLVMMVSTLQMQARSLRLEGIDVKKIVLHIYERWKNHELFFPFLKHCAQKEEGQWAKGKRIDLLSYEMTEIELGGGGIEEKRAFLDEYIAIVCNQSDTAISSCLQALSVLNIQYGHAFDEQIMKLQKRLGLSKCSKIEIHNKYESGSNNQVYNGDIINSKFEK